MELRSAMRLPPSRHVACRAAAVRLAPRAAGGVSTSISVSHYRIRQQSRLVYRRVHVDRVHSTSTQGTAVWRGSTRAARSVR